MIRAIGQTMMEPAVRTSIIFFIVAVAIYVLTPQTIGLMFVMCFTIPFGVAIGYTLLHWQRKPVGINKDENQILP